MLEILGYTDDYVVSGNPSKVNTLALISTLIDLLACFLFANIAPAAPTSCNVTLLYDQSSRRLQFIDTTWDWMPVSHITGYVRNTDRFESLCVNIGLLHMKIGLRDLRKENPAGGPRDLKRYNLQQPSVLMVYRAQNNSRPSASFRTFN